MNIESYNGMVVKNVRRIIDEKGLKQRAVAGKAGINEKEFSDMLNNRRIIKAADIASVAWALGVDPNELFILENDDVPPEKSKMKGA